VVVSRKLAQRGTASIAQLPAQPQGHLPSSQSPIVSKLHFFNSVTGNDQQIPTYRVLDGVGKPIDGAEIPEVHSSCPSLFPISC